MDISTKYYTSNIPRIPSDIKSAWTKELRDPDTPQAKGYLRSEDGMCCLGVLCEKTLNLPPTFDLFEGVFAYGKENETQALPNAALNTLWGEAARGLGIHSNPNIFTARSPKFNHRPYDFSLAWLNDKGLTFSQIADVIDYFL